MKIYANDYADTVHTPFDQYIGKNVWVTCYLQGATDDNYDYVRFLSKEVRGPHKPEFVRVSVDRIGYRQLEAYRENPKLFYGTDYNPVRARNLADQDVYGINAFRLTTPVEVYTTEELFGFTDYTFGNPVIDRFVGKPIWVLADKDGMGTYYVQILEKHGDVVNCNIIDPNYLDEDYEYDYWDSCPDDWITNVTMHVDSLKVVEPLYVLSDEEVQEAYDRSSAIYEEGYYANEGDEEEEDGED